MHETKEVPREEAVKIGSAFYHKDCAKNKENIKLAIELFQTHINKNPVYTQLHAIINNIVFVKNIDSDFLVFALRYYIDNKIPLRYPQGLYYVVQNKEAADAFEKKRAEKFKNVKVDLSETKEVEFTHRPTKQKGFADILGGT